MDWYTVLKGIPPVSGEWEADREAEQEKVDLLLAMVVGELLKGLIEKGYSKRRLADVLDELRGLLQ